MISLLLLAFVGTFCVLLSRCLRNPPASIVPVTANLTYGYVTTDASADGNIFWWFRKASPAAYSRAGKDVDAIPLLIFLQGGPGASDWFGELCEHGPFDFDCGAPSAQQPSEPRKRPPLRSLNDLGHVFLVDSPLGAGFSYVMNSSGYVQTDAEVGEQLLTVLGSVIDGELSFLQGSSVWFLGESYGGKMAAHFATRVLSSGLDLRVAGLGLLDTWISPQSCVESYGEFLRATSQIDTQQKETLDEMAAEIRELTKQGRMDEAGTLLYHEQLRYINFTEVNMYDVTMHKRYDLSKLTKYMNEVVKPSLGGIVPSWVTWHNINATTREHLMSVFVTPATEQVLQLLNAGVQVAVFQGQLDVCVNVLCTLDWVENGLVGWGGLEHWKKASREKVRFDNSKKKKGSESSLLGYRKKYQELDFWWILDAGHMLPMNQPASFHLAMESVLYGGKG